MSRRFGNTERGPGASHIAPPLRGRSRATGPVGCALALAAALLLPAPLRAETVALTGGTIHDMTGREPFVGTVVIDGTKITAVGPGVAVPPGARTMDVTGLHVYPGLIDAMSNLGLTEVTSVKATVDNKEVGAMNPNVRAEVAINPDSELLPVARVNGITTAVVAPDGDLVAGTSALVHLDGWTWEDMTVAAPLALYIYWPGKSPWTPWGGDPEAARKNAKARRENLELLKTAFADARAYATARKAAGSKGVPRHDLEPKWEAMIPAIDRTIPVVIRARLAVEIEEAVKWAEEENLRMILAGGEEAFAVLDLLKSKEIPVILDPMFDVPTRRDLPYDRVFTLPADLDRAGVRFAFSMDKKAPDSRNLPYSAALAVSHGLSETRAMEAMTRIPAEIFGVADKVGTLAPGRFADILVTDGSPLELGTSVRHVFIAGKEMPLESKHTRLYEKYRNRPRPANR